ncbi:MAG: Hpt domain-containing protein [Pseudobdellovibrio sp.]
MNILNQSAIETLRDLQKKTGRNLLGDLIKLYIETTPPIFINMKTHLKANAFEDLSREAHSLKSSSANIGAIKIEELARTIEYKIIRNEACTPELLLNLITEIEKIFPETCMALSSLN